MACGRIDFAPVVDAGATCTATTAQLGDLAVRPALASNGSAVAAAWVRSAGSTAELAVATITSSVGVDSPVVAGGASAVFSVPDLASLGTTFGTAWLAPSAGGSALDLAVIGAGGDLVAPAADLRDNDAVPAFQTALVQPHPLGAAVIWNEFSGSQILLMSVVDGTGHKLAPNVVISTADEEVPIGFAFHDGEYGLAYTVGNTAWLGRRDPSGTVLGTDLDTTLSIDTSGVQNDRMVWDGSAYALVIPVATTLTLARFDAALQPLSMATVATAVAPDQIEGAQLAAVGSGDYLVAWGRRTQGTDSINVGRFDATGAPRGSVFDRATALGPPSFAIAAAGTDGTAVVAWTEAGTSRVALVCP